MNDDDLDAVLARAMRAATPTVDTDGVLEQLERRRAARRRARRNRRVAWGAGVTAAAAAVVIVASIGTTDRQDLDAVDTAAPAPAPTAAPLPDAVGDPVPRLDEVRVPGEGGRTTALGAVGTSFWVARGDEPGPGRRGPDLVSEVRTDGTVVATTAVQGIARSVTADADRVWLVVEEPTVDARGPRWRLKEVRRSDGALLRSSEIPADGPVVGVALDDTGRIEARSRTDRWTFARDGALVDRTDTDRTDTDRADEPAGVEQWVRSGDRDWLLWRGDPAATPIVSSDGSDDVEVPGGRRLVAVDAARRAAVAVEVAVADSSGAASVALRLVDAGPSGELRVTRTLIDGLPPDVSIAGLDRDAVWVLDDTTLWSTPAG